MTAFDSVMNGAVLEREALHVVTGTIHGLADGLRPFAGLARTHADATVAVANNRKSGESENAATLNNLRDAVNRDHLFAQTVALFVDHLIFTLSLSHFALP